MALKDLAVPALCVLGTLYLFKGCDSDKTCAPCCRSVPFQPVNRVYRKPIQKQPTYYREVYEEPQVQTVIRRRVIRKTIRTTTVPVYDY